MLLLMTAGLAAAALVSADSTEASAEAILDTAFTYSVDNGTREDWRFLMSISTNYGDVTARFDGSAPTDEQWVLLSPALEDMSPEQTEIWEDIIDPSEDDSEGSGLFFSVAELDLQPGTLNLVSHANGESIWSFSPVLDEEDAQFADYIVGELTISGDDPAVQTVRVYAPESFKPHMAVRVNAFEMRQEYAIIDGLPTPVLQVMTQRVSGSAAFQTFEENVVIHFSEIEYIAE